MRVSSNQSINLYLYHCTAGNETHVAIGLCPIYIFISPSGSKESSKNYKSSL